jgi:ORF6N domain
LIPLEKIQRTIVRLRGQDVMLASDLARIYGVETRALNQAVKRNSERFPQDFVFRLTREETIRVERSRSQTVILKWGENVKYAPLAFTEYGAIMAANVLSSPRAVRTSILVVRAFVGLRQTLRGNIELARRLAALERKYDGQFDVVFEVIKELTASPSKRRKRIGFSTSECA